LSSASAGECVHLIRIPMSRPMPAQLTALCGEHVNPGQAEVLDTISGMPCQRCLRRSSPTSGFLTTAS
jgi:hypothetical protein